MRKPNEYFIRDEVSVIVLSKGFALVDTWNLEEVLLRRWYNNKGYVVTHSKTDNRRLIYMHNIILGVTVPNNKVVAHHINGKGFDNRECNVKLVPAAVNIHNGKIRGISSYRGVTVNTAMRSTKPWKAEIRFDGKYKYLGIYNTEEEAAEAYNKAAAQIYGEDAALNEV